MLRLTPKQGTILLTELEGMVDHLHPDAQAVLTQLREQLDHPTHDVDLIDRLATIGRRQKPGSGFSSQLLTTIRRAILSPREVNGLVRLATTMACDHCQQMFVENEGVVVAEGSILCTGCRIIQVVRCSEGHTTGVKLSRIKCKTCDDIYNGRPIPVEVEAPPIGGEAALDFGAVGTSVMEEGIDMPPPLSRATRNVVFDSNGWRILQAPQAPQGNSRPTVTPRDTPAFAPPASRRSNQSIFTNIEQMTERAPRSLAQVVRDMDREGRDENR